MTEEPIEVYASYDDDLDVDADEDAAFHQSEFIRSARFLDIARYEAIGDTEALSGIYFDTNESDERHRAVCEAALRVLPEGDGGRRIWEWRLAHDWAPPRPRDGEKPMPAPAPPPPPIEDDPEAFKAAAYALSSRVMLRRAAEEIATERLAEMTPAQPINGWLLKDTPVIEEQWFAEGLLAADCNMAIIAMNKTGKTVCALNFGHAAITGQPFMGRFAMTALGDDEQVAFFNFEVTPSTLAYWANAMSIPGDRLYGVHMRGQSGTFASARGRRELSQRLVDNNVKLLIVDPFGRAFTGNQDSNSEVGPWLQGLDEFALGAGVRSTVLIQHAGWSGEHARGASALEDWPDTKLYLTRPDTSSPDRFMRVTGRHVEVPEDRINYDPETHLMTLAGVGSRKTAAQEARISELLPVVYDVINDEPGINIAGIEEALRRADVTLSNGLISKVSVRGVEKGMWSVFSDASGKHHTVDPDPADLPVWARKTS